MQDRPSKEVLLDALSNFLIQQVRPAISDPGLNFRTLIAANLAMVVANEIRTEEQQNATELARLRALMPELPAAPTETQEQLRAAILNLNRALARKLRDGSFDASHFGRALDHTKQALIEKLAVNNPRFDTAADIEAAG